MKRFLACVLLAFAATAIAIAADVSGKWTGSFTSENGDAESALLVLKQDGAVITGTAGPDENQQFPIQTGKVDGIKIVLDIAPGEGAVYHLELVLDGDRMKGDLTAKRDDQTMTAKLDLARAK